MGRGDPPSFVTSDPDTAPQVPLSVLFTAGCRTSQAGGTAKLLGVVFNREVRWKDHVQQAVDG